MTDADMAVANDGEGRFSPEFAQAVLDRQAELPQATPARLAELLVLAAYIDCYYGPQSQFLGLCAAEAAARLRLL